MQPLSEHPFGKRDALVELLVLVEHGRTLLAQQIAGRPELAVADVARAGWDLQVKKALRRLFGEAAGQVRFAAAFGTSPLGPAPRLADEVRAFQDQVLHRIASLERVVLLLQRIA